MGDNFGNGFDNDHPLENKGPLDRDCPTYSESFRTGSTAQGLPGGIFVSYSSKPPFSAFLGDLDLNGDGTTDDLLPGTKANQFNRGLGKEDLRHLVDAVQHYLRGWTGRSGKFHSGDHIAFKI